MHKADFKRIARAAAIMRQHLASTTFEELVDQLALACDEPGSKFDYERFHDACYSEPTP